MYIFILKKGTWTNASSYWFRGAFHGFPFSSAKFCRISSYTLVGGIICYAKNGWRISILAEHFACNLRYSSVSMDTKQRCHSFLENF